MDAPAADRSTDALIADRPAGAPAGRYPKELEVSIGGPAYTPEDYPALLKAHGRYVVVLGRFDEEITGIVAPTAILKLGMFGRCARLVPLSDVSGYLADAHQPIFEGRDRVLVCTPPISGEQALAIAELVMSEESFLSSKLATLDALDALAALDESRAAAIVADALRHFAAERRRYGDRATEVAPPTGKWSKYSRNAAPARPVQPDHLADAIKSFAVRSVQVYPPLPPTDPAEADALLHIHDALRRNGMHALASRLMHAALSTPGFAHLCHREALFDPQRSPPVSVTWRDFGPDLLGYLLSEELTHAASRGPAAAPVTPSAPFILTLDEIIAMGVPNSPPSAAHAFGRLDRFVGGYLAELDLRRTLVTGSAIAAALIVTDVEREFSRADWNDYARYEAYIAAHYPAVKTTPWSRDAYETVAEMAHQEGAVLTYVTDRRDGAYILILRVSLPNGAGIAATLDVGPGADLDMAIDVDTDEEFDEVARGHYDVIRRHHPTAVLGKVTRGDPADPRYTWAIASGCPGAISTFRAVEMYRADFGNVVTHHVGMVSGAFTALFSKEGEGPKFVVSARLACAMADLATPNYYYFASRKHSPQHIVMKYYARGFGLQAFPSEIATAIKAAFRNDPVWGWRGRLLYPATGAKGNFSAYSLPAEIAAARR